MINESFVNNILSEWSHRQDNNPQTCNVYFVQFLAIGQYSCNFNTDFCNLAALVDPSSLRWKRVGSDSSRVPNAGVGGSGHFLYMNADDVVSRIKLVT